MTAPSATTPRVGTVLADRYELVAHLARGGMGDVYEALDRLLGRRVAVKVYRAASPADRDRFDGEVRCLAGLSHPGLVQVFDAGPWGDDAFVVLELIDGPPFSDRLREGRPLPPQQVAGLGVEVADALDHIHGHGVVHRDVTPANVLCGPDGRARLVDFGIVRLLDSPRVTTASLAIGTPAYMAPEQVQGLDVTPAADVYSLGLVLLEALTARHEFPGPVQEAAVARLVRDPDTTTGVPAAWRSLLGAMVQRAPADRPTAAEVRRRLAPLAAGSETATVPILVAPGPPVTPGPPAPAEATTVAISGTELLPAMALGAAAPTTGVRPNRYWALAVGLVAAVALVLVLAANAGSKPASSTTATTTILTTPTTVSATTTTAVAVAPPAAPVVVARPPSPHGHGKGKKG